MIRFAGIRFRVHPLFVLVMLLSVLTGYWLELATLFGVVLIHELGHAFAARHFGWSVAEVQLLPFGGVMMTDDVERAPFREELAVALAGPFQHIWMIGLAVLLRETGAWTAEWSDYFVRANGTVMLFNLLPILPLDGGKIIQSPIGLTVPYYRTVRLCIWLSLAMSAVLILIALGAGGKTGVQFNLLLIGVFLLAANWHGHRTEMFHFFRFLAHRNERSGELAVRGTLALPIVVDGRRTVRDTVKLFFFFF